MIDDLILKVRDRFELVVLVATRAIEISRGEAPKIDAIHKSKKEKEVITALKEISQGSVDISRLKENAIANYRYKGKQPYNKSISQEKYSRKTCDTSSHEKNHIIGNARKANEDKFTYSDAL
jgi:DNA-directed RNA polymerase omega subunit